MTRSEIMRRNVGDNLKPELTVHLYLQELGIQCERNDSMLPGTPDFAFYNGRLAVFVHGCFWHHCPKHGKLPKTNRKFWRDKFEQNRLRDARARRALRKMGWATMVVWEHDLKKLSFAAGARVKRRLDRVRLDALTSQYRMPPKEKARRMKLREKKRRRVKEDCGFIPSMQDWFKHVRPAPWMLRTAVKPEAVTKDERRVERRLGFLPDCQKVA